MADNMEVIISAVDEASSIFQAIANSCSEMMSAITGSADEASSSIDELAPAAETVESAIESIDTTNITEVGSAADESSSSADELSNSLDNIDGSSLTDAAGAADELGGSLGDASGAADELSNSLSIIEGSMLLSAAEQIGSLAGNSEEMAQSMNDAAISVGQLATMTGVAEPEMVSLINNISNATFPNDEAMMYVKNLSQMGVESSNFAKSATDIDKINDAFGMGAQTTNSLATELSVLGVDMNDVSTSFNALAYANANTKGGMDNFFAFLRKYDSDLNQLGYDVDQSSMIFVAATQKYGGGKAALSGLSNALKEADGDTRKLEEALGLEAGALDNASAVTGKYEGQLDQLAAEEAEHKTILDQVGAAWEDISLQMSGVMSPAASVLSVIGEIGSFGMTVKGLKELSTTFNELKESKYATAAANYVQAASETVLAAATSAYGFVVDVLTGEIGLATAATEIWNAVLAMNPLVLVAVAAIGLAVAIYEVGKAFGWWTDVSSMMDAVWAGVNRLWNAFINHPDVQSFISALTTAWNIMSSAIGRVINWVGSFFNASSNSNFDIVRAAINLIGAAWNAMTLPIRSVIRVIHSFLSIQKTGRDAARGFVNAVINLIKTLPNRVAGFLKEVSGKISSAGSTWYNNASSAAKNIEKGVTNTITNLPNTVYNKMLSIGTNLLKAGSDLYNKAKSVGQSIWNGLTSALGGGGAMGFDYEGMIEAMKGSSSVAVDLKTGEDFNIFTGQAYEVKETTDINLNESLEITFDFKHVPEGTSEERLLQLLEEFITDKAVINRLVNDPTFQSLDAKVKEKIINKAKRARGV